MALSLSYGEDLCLFLLFRLSGAGRLLECTFELVLQLASLKYGCKMIFQRGKLFDV